MKRIYHHYEKLEEYQNGMWKNISKKDQLKCFYKAILFTGNAKLYGKYMLKVVNEWPISCEHNLTCKGMNRQAWIGHAACCLAIGSPEDITRLAWHELSVYQQEQANNQASYAINLWEKNYNAKD